MKKWSFTATAPVRADLELPAGSIEVLPGAADHLEVVIEPVRPGRRGDEYAEAIEVSFEADRLGVHAPTRGFRFAELRCTVSLPEHSILSIRTASADIRATARLGSFDGKSASGDVRLSRVDGDCSLDTASGDLACDEVSGNTRVRGASCDVTITHSGGDVEVSVASGNVDLGGLGGSAKLRTASGDVTVRQATRGTVQVNTVSGNVTVGVAAGTGARLDVTSVSGETTCALPFSEQGASQAPLRINCKTVSGDVRIEAAGPVAAPVSAG